MHSLCLGLPPPSTHPFTHSRARVYGDGFWTHCLLYGFCPLLTWIFAADLRRTIRNKYSSVGDGHGGEGGEGREGRGTRRGEVQGRKGGSVKIAKQRVTKGKAGPAKKSNSCLQERLCREHAGTMQIDSFLPCCTACSHLI